jgi:hypothetical protein
MVCLFHFVKFHLPQIDVPSKNPWTLLKRENLIHMVCINVIEILSLGEGEGEEEFQHIYK